MKRLLSILSLLFAVSFLSFAANELPLSPSDLQEQVITRTGFTVSWNRDTKCPNWVAWDLTAEEASAKAASREEDFYTDPDAKLCPDTRDYSRSGYDRGHMAPAADMKWSPEAMYESFYLSNICPQNRELNGGLWLELEQRCRVYAKRYGTLWICCGPVFGKNPKTIGQAGVSVPEAFFKVVLMQYKGKYKAIGFLMPNESLDVQENIFKYRKDISDIEKITDLTFFAKAPAEAKAAKSDFDRFPWDIQWSKPRK